MRDRPRFLAREKKYPLRLLVRVRRCVIVPHIASATFETRFGMVDLAARNALAGIDDEAMPAELDVAARIAG